VLFTEQECSYRQDYARYLQQHKFFPNNVLETASVEAIKKYVINGLGVSYLPYYAVEEEAKAGLLKKKIPPTDVRFFTQIAYHRKKWLSPAIQALIELSQETSKQWTEE
jgi:DNA-binding transcriptional LysR family regulator